MCVGLNCGAQLPHCCGGGQVVSDDVADDEGGTQRGQADGVEPVPADSRAAARGPVCPGRLRCGSVGAGPGQQSLLQSECRRLLAGVAAGVVDRQRGAGADLGEHVEVRVVERVGLLYAPYRDHAQCPAAGGERRDDQ